MTSTQSTPVPTNDRIKVMSVEEGKEMFDRIARRTMNMSGEEFIEAWESGKLDDQPETPALTHLVMLIPFTR